PAKIKWRNIVTSYFRKTQRKTIRKIDFPKLLNELLSTSFSTSAVSGGFRRAGIWPLNEEAMKGKVVRGRLSTYTTEILSSLISEITTSRVVDGNSNNTSVPASVDHDSAPSSPSSSRPKRTLDDSDSDESIDIQPSHKNKSTFPDSSDQDSDYDVESSSNQNFSIPTSTSTVTTAKVNPSAAIRSIIATYLKDQPASTTTAPKKSRVRFERRFGEDITNSNLLNELKEKAKAKKKAHKQIVTSRSSKK
ncbi:unnamed protein product, partial [Rotaria sordida]